MSSFVLNRSCSKKHIYERGLEELKAMYPSVTTDYHCYTILLQDILIHSRYELG